MARLRLSVLGPFSAWLDERPLVKFESDKVRALLTFLVVEAGRPHRRSALSGLFWPDSAEKAARASLRNALSNLRLITHDQQIMQDHQSVTPFIVTDQETIQFNPVSDHWIDVHEFEEKIAAGSGENFAADDETRIGLLKEAVDLYQGNFLQGFSLRDSPAFEEWQRHKQERLFQLAMSALSLLTDYFEKKEEYRLACDYAQRQVNLAPWQEVAHRTLMRLFAKSGQRSLAVAQYDECRRDLEAELGVQPDRETLLLYEQIRAEPSSEAVKAETRQRNLPPVPSRPINPEKANILITKLYAPLPHRNLVPRPRLIDQLCSGLFDTVTTAFSRKLTLISAPAGYGKTTLAVTWVQQAGVPFAWLSLDAHDNDPAHFLTGLLAALSTVAPGLTGAGLPGKGMDPLAPDTILTPLVNAIAVAATPFILAFDDYHVIHDRTVHRLLNFLVENLPDCAHLAIISREDPPLALARLRAAGQVVEIRQADLSFNREEVADFFRRSISLEIGAEDLEALAQRTEGWVVGLQLVAISLQRGGYLRDFLQSFAGSHHFIVDYMVDEVFNKLPEHLRNFLLKTAILDRFSAPLCVVVTGREDSAEIISRLEAANAFIIPLDPDRVWYRFHHLFVELLRHRLRQEKNISEKDLHRAAAGWLYEHGDPREAIHHALAGEDWERAAEWIHVPAGALLKRGEIINLLGWFLRFPETIYARNPHLALDYCWPLILSGQLERAEHLLDQASGRAYLTAEEQGETAAARAFIARSRGDSRQTLEWSEKALALLPKEGSHIRGLLAVNLGIAYWHIGLLEESERAMRDAHRVALSTQNQYSLLTSLIFLNRVQAARGWLRTAFQAYGPLREMLDPIPILALAHMDIAVLHYEWNELEACAAHLEASIAIGERTRSVEFQSSAHNQLAHLKLAHGDLEGASVELLRARQLLEGQSVTPLTLARSAAALAQMAIIRGDMREAEHWAELAGDSADPHPFYPFAGLIRARLLLAQHKLTAAQEELARVDALAIGRHWGFARVEILALMTLAARSTAAALGFLKETLSLGGSEGFLRTFIDAARLPFTPAQPLTALLKEAARQGIFPEYTGRILALIESEAQNRANQVPRGNGTLAEPVSARELEVLRLVAAGLTNQQIADQLVVSLSTVKSHVHHISGKVGAENRTQTVARARELKLI